MARLALHLLGPFEAVVHEHVAVGFRSDKARVLLAYLAVEADRPHARDALAELLWPAHPPAVGRTYLRSALMNLRSLLDAPTAAATGTIGAVPAAGATGTDAAPPFLLSTRDTIQINPAADVWVDAVALGRLLSGPRVPDALEQAVALFRGPFLEGLSVADSPAFDEWLLFTGEQFNRQALAALQSLAALYLEAGQYSAAAASARRQLALDAWDETAHRQLMAALALEGNRSAALAQYARCRTVLTQEVGVDPSNETTLLAQRIRAGTLDEVWTRAQADRNPAHSACAASPRAPYALPAVLARECELERMQHHMDQALQGAGRVVFVAGGAGSGKTTLLHEFGRQVLRRHAGAAVAVARCSDFAGAGDPYLPFRMVLQMLNGDIESPQAGTLLCDSHTQRIWAVAPVAAEVLADTALNLLGRLLPAEPFLLRVEAMAVRDDRTAAAWRKHLVQWPQQSALTPAALEPHDLFATVTNYLLTLSRRVPLLLLIDDVQWADTGSIGLLFHLGRQLAGSRILVVAAYRPEQVALGIEGERALLMTARCELQRITGDLDIDLDQADGRQFVEALLDSEPNRLGAAFREMLYTRTEGHPLFTVELLHRLCEQGVLAQADDGACVQARPTSWESLPPRVEAVVAERVGQLPSEWRELLKVASVCGEPFSAEVVARAALLDERRVCWALSEPLRRQHRLVQPEGCFRIEPQGQRLSRYRFAHAFFQQYLYDSLDGAERAQLHERVARALEALYGPSVDEIAVHLARHYAEAAIPDKAAHFHKVAGDQAMRVSACEQAIVHYQHALALLAALPPSPPRAEQERALYVALAQPLKLMQGWGSPATVNAVTRALALGRTTGGRVKVVETLLMLADEQVGRGDSATARALGEELARLAQETGDPQAALAAHWVLGEACFGSAEPAPARLHLEQAIALLVAHKSVSLQLALDLEVTSNSWLAWVLWILGFPEQSYQASQAALARARLLDKPGMLGFALSVAGAILDSLRGDVDAAQMHAAELAELAETGGLLSFKPIAAVFQGFGRVAQGEHDAGLAQIRQGLDARDASGTIAGRVALMLTLVRALRMAGQIEQALDVMEETLAFVAASGLRLMEAELWHNKGELLLVQGADTAAAEACFQHALALAHAQQARLWELRAAVNLSRLWQARGEQNAAYALLAPLYNWFTEGFDTPDLQAARALLDALA